MGEENCSGRNKDWKFRKNCQGIEYAYRR